MADQKMHQPTNKWQLKTAAKRIGIPLEDYFAHLATGEKWCTRCRVWHSQSTFTIDRSRGDGLSASCRGRADRPKPTPLTPSEKRERANAGYRKYYAGTGGPRIRAQKAARKRGLAVIPPWWREEQLRGGCAYCPAPATTLDHVIPVSGGGPTVPGNLVPACVNCNSKKKASNPAPWIAIMRIECLERIGTQPMGGIGALNLIDDTDDDTQDAS